MRKLMILGAALVLVGCSDIRADQRLECEKAGGRYFESTGADDDVCVFSRDPSTRVQFNEDD